MFSKVLIANRGEIACRVIRTLRAMGIGSVAVYSDADAGAKHVRDADEAVHLGPTNARESYLNIEKVIAAAQQTGAKAIHPGYGFLAENAAFATACKEAGIVFIGPSAEAIETMGDKISAKATVSAAGVPVVPGRAEPGMTDDDLYAAALEVGFPVLIKPSAGGGGKGMYLVEDEMDLRSSISSARREAAGSFGDDTLFLERFVKDPRHIEVQVLADNHGNTIHLGERECSLQRRHQKIIEEAPSPLLDETTRARIGQAAVDTAAAVSYSGAGTVEFIVASERPDEFFFMEMNTRLQVEHPVTEMVTGVDLVEQQILVAAGAELDLTQDDIVLDGHSIEARLYAENPDREFLPTGGTVLHLDEGGLDSDTIAGDLGFFAMAGGMADDFAGSDSVGPYTPPRVDSALIEGLEVATTYDPMIAKVIVHGDDREDALELLDAALADYELFGVVTNINFLRRLINHPAVRAGEMDTGLVGREIENLVRQPVPVEVYASIAARYIEAARETTGYGDDPWERMTGWRACRSPAPVHFAVRGIDGEKLPVDALVLADRNTGGPYDLEFELSAGELRHRAAAAFDWDGPMIVAIDDEQPRAVRLLVEPHQIWVHAAGGTYLIPRIAPEQELGGPGAGSGEIRSPMPGTVIAVHTEPGAEVIEDDPLIAIEAMKMEHVLRAPITGTVSQFDIVLGASVALDQLLMTVEADPA